MRVDPEARRVDTSIRASSEGANTHRQTIGRHDALCVSTSPEHHAWMAPAAPYEPYTSPGAFPVARIDRRMAIAFQSRGSS